MMRRWRSEPSPATRQSEFVIQRASRTLEVLFCLIFAWSAHVHTRTIGSLSAQGRCADARSGGDRLTSAILRSRRRRFASSTTPSRRARFSSTTDSTGWVADLARLIAAFEARERLPRFEFMEEYAPGLPAILRRAGFAEEARQTFMVCEATNFRAVRAAAGIDDPYTDFGFAGRRIAARSSPRSARASARTTRRRQTRRRRNGSVRDWTSGVASAWLRWLDGEPVGAAGCTAILDGLSELVGVATPPRYRRRGIATALSAAAVGAQFAAGAEAVILTAQDAAAGRIYERVGFRPFGVSLAYSLAS